MGTQYKNPPLVEALCEIHFDILEWDITYPADFYNLVKDEFPIKKTLETKDIYVVVSGSDVGFNSSPQLNKPILQCTNESENIVIQFTEKNLVISVNSPYIGWNRFKELIIEIQEKCFNVIGEKVLGPIDLSYRNTLRTGTTHSYENTKAHLNLYPNIPNIRSTNSPTAIQLLVELPSDDGKSVSVIQQNTLKSVDDIEAPIALNLKYICLSPETINFDLWLDEAHNVIQDTFESSVTDLSKSKF